MPTYDRIVDIQQRVVSKDALGGESVFWDKLVTVWANVDQTGVSEDFENDANRVQALRNAKFRILWRNDITELHRIVYDGLAWSIEGIGEIGYRRELELFCQTDVDRSAQAIGFTAIAGLSVDATPEASELTIGHTAGRFTFQPITAMYILFARRTNEPDIRTIVDSADPTATNQIGGWMKFATPVPVIMEEYNVWVSEHAITTPTARTLEVG